ncbi:MAG: tetratricopeptide repeat protein [Planctomycetes bacterium]|nr:tetratricopeptide repeat protein [Planctomycetota bacterium]
MSSSTPIAQRQTAKVTSSSVVRKIEPRTTTRQKTRIRSNSSLGKTSDTTFDVYGSASARKGGKTVSKASKPQKDHSSRMKVIEVGDKSKRVATNTLSTDISRVRIDPKKSSAAGVVDTKRVSRRLTSGRTREGRTGGSTLSTISSRRTSVRSRTPKTTTISTNTAIVTATDLNRRNPALRTSLSRSRRSGPRIVINGDNNVVVQGSVTTSTVRPQISSRRLTHDISCVHHRRRWKNHSGLYFSFAWSGSSCGRVAYLPYRYHHSWSRYPIVSRPYYGLSYYYPRYHRRYIYVSIGGYWPSWYRYRRYYWYGCHPYYWYGASVITEPYQNVTYNTYNYYDTNDDQPQDEPEYQTAADLCFSRAVELFEAGNYADAVLQLREAVSLSPDDIVLPFTYSQALFANGDYAHAASVLREAIAQIPDDELTVYYPRGLYKDEAILTEQIAQLEAAVGKEPFDSDYQLLLGYQYLGIGDLDKARQPLTEAAQSTTNMATAGKLQELSEKLETEAPENTL